ncbi:MAG: S41 family peptidase [Planctomycetota bacterium]
MKTQPYSLWHLLVVPMLCGVMVFFLVHFLVRWNENLPVEELSVLRREHEAEALLHEAIAGMVRSLDPHSRYIPPAELESFRQEEIAGSYTGVGVALASGVAPPTIEFRYPASPGRSAGLQVGDEILAVNGEEIGDLPAAEGIAAVITRISAAKEDPVLLRIRRGEATEMELPVNRGEVGRPSVKWLSFLDEGAGIAYLHLSEFKERSIEEFDQAIEILRGDDEAELQGLILDLRFNRGGLLSAAIALANRFLESGRIVSLKRRDGEVVEEHDADPIECDLPKIPLVLLMNGSSASASEVVAGALQDHDRARIVGERSFGKGVVQEILGGREPDFRLKLTTSHYYTPDGRSIERRLRREEDGADPGGIEPDRTEPMQRELRQLVAAALAQPEPPRDDRPAVLALAEKLGISPPAPLPAEEDSQLQAAIEELRELLEGQGAAGEVEKGK